ncbi:MAG: hypothetical protein MZV64_11190 [Ignavibacteriales bacterium]|nr:hypothetical protein [Ignavibacteriales bacterium]
MPLIETVTGPDMRTPQEVAEVAQILRRLVRSTGHVRTGMGAAREDVNVSVRGGTRIEIKGVPRIPRIPLLTYHEAMRQWNLLRLREELRRRGVTPETFRSGAEDVTRILHSTSYQPDPRGPRRRRAWPRPSSCAASATSWPGRRRRTPASRARSPTASGSSPA